MAAIPLVWKIGGIVALIALLIGGYEGWAYHERSLGAAELAAKNAQAIIKQKEAAAKLSASLLVKLQAEKTALQSVAEKAGAKIDLEPVVEGSPAEQDAAAAVRCMLDKTLCF